MKKRMKIAVILWTCMLLCACGQDAEQNAEQVAEQIDKEQMVTQVSQPEGTDSQETQPETETASQETQPETEASQPETQEPVLTAKVPDGLQTLLKESFLAGTSAETLKPMVIDVVVEAKAHDSYRGLGIDDVLDYLEQWGGILLRVDADNDGIEDLFAWIRDGGSSGNTSFQLARGKEDGTYEVTAYQGSMSQEIAFVEFEGQNYLLETEFEYNRKAVNGFTVTAYEQGRVSEQVYLEVVPFVWEPDILSCTSGYEALAEHYAEIGKEGFHDENMYDYRVDAGSGEWVEQKEAKVYHADINNDGVEEWYEKYIFYPSSIGAYICIEDELYFQEAPDEREELISYYDLQYDGIPLTFWVEEVITGDSEQAKKVVCLLTYRGLSTNHIYGYLIEGEAVTEVFEIEYEGQLEWRN